MPAERQAARVWAEPRTVAAVLLLGLWPVAWVAPLAEAGVLPWIGGRELTVLGAVAALWEADWALALLVAALGVVFPYAKAVAGLLLALGRLGPGARPWLGVLAKLAMADVFLVALYVVAAKGVGVGYVETAWGLWLFTACALLSIWTTAGPAPPFPPRRAP